MKSYKKVRKFLLESSESDSDVSEIEEQIRPKPLKFIKTMQRIREIQKKKTNLEFSQVLINKSIKKKSILESIQNMEGIMKNSHHNFRKYKLDQTFSKIVVSQRNENSLPKNRKRSSRIFSDSEESVFEDDSSSENSSGNRSLTRNSNTCKPFDAFVNTRKRRRVFLDDSISGQTNQLDVTENQALENGDSTSINANSTESSLNSSSKSSEDLELTASIESSLFTTNPLSEETEKNSQFEESNSIAETNAKLAMETKSKPKITSNVNVSNFLEFKQIQILLKRITEQSKLNKKPRIL